MNEKTPRAVSGRGSAAGLLPREKSASAIRLASALRMLGERDAAFASKSRALRDAEARVRSLEQALDESEARVRSLEQALGESEARVRSLEQESERAEAYAKEPLAKHPVAPVATHVARGRPQARPRTIAPARQDAEATKLKDVLRSRGLREFSQLEGVLRKELMGARRKGVGMARDILGRMTRKSEGGRA